MTEPETRAAYNTVAADYAELVGTELDHKPYDRAMLATFAELVTNNGGGEVADIGCGPGRITHHLATIGITAHGIDLSPGMITVAKHTYPDLDFRVGSMRALDIADNTLAGLVAWYSIIHIPTAELPDVFSEFHRVLRPGGHAVLAFQVGDEHRQRHGAYGHADVTINSWRRTPQHVREQLTRSGLPVHAELVRAADDLGYETSPQAYLIATKPRG